MEVLRGDVLGERWTEAEFSCVSWEERWVEDGSEAAGRERNPKYMLGRGQCPSRRRKRLVHGEAGIMLVTSV